MTSLVATFVAGCGPAGPRAPVHTAIESASFTEPMTRIFFDDLASSDLSVRRAPGTAVEITRKLKWRGDKGPRYSETWEGQTLRVSYSCPYIGCSIDYDVQVPEGVEVQAKISSGDVEVNGMAAPVTIETSSGDVRLTGVKGTVTVKATSGDVSAVDLVAERATVSTSSGDVNLDFAAAPQSVGVRVTSGDTTILLPPHDAYLVEARTTSGEQKITVDRSQSASRKIDVEATSGDVRIGYGRARSGGTPSPS
ncbi:MAG TPA: DUF4097 family beta strand repeat-containing protein [Candidatus Limnocylindrales bacterium]|nr:DUF4097 family beta strand repeat-containing protein [Candidatus Limnocylindrales bacterium]